MDSDTHEMSAQLQSIYDLELALGNTPEFVFNQPGLPLIVAFARPIHKAEAEAKMRLGSRLKWTSFGPMAGYVDQETGQSVQGPQDASAIRSFDKSRLSPALQPIFEFELTKGNEVARVDEPGGSKCPLAVLFKYPLHKEEIAVKWQPLLHVEWIEITGPYYTPDGEGGYMCTETGHAIIGPMRLTH
jgi:hypothetical protein